MMFREDNDMLNLRTTRMLMPRSVLRVDARDIVRLNGRRDNGVRGDRAFDAIHTERQPRRAESSSTSAPRAAIKAARIEYMGKAQAR